MSGAWIENWITIGMSKFDTPGFQDTSRLMTSGFTGRAVYVEPPYKATLGFRFKWNSTTPEENLTVLHPPGSIPRKLDPLRLSLKVQTRVLDAFISRRFGGNWREHTAIYVTNWSYYQQPLVRLLKPKYLIFDMVDDILSFPYEFSAAKVLNQLQWFAKHAYTSLAVSPALKKLALQQLGIEPSVLPNGVDADHFINNGHVGEVEVENSGIKVGFAGTLNHWIDYRMMYELLEKSPRVTLYICGCEGNFGSKQTEIDYFRLKAHPRARILGPIPYSKLPGFLHKMDVLLLPRIPSASSESSCPLKLFEYLAVGKPILSFGVPLPRDVAQLVYHATSTDELCQAFEAASQEHPTSCEVEQRRNYAAQHTWKNRVEQVLNLIH